MDESNDERPGKVTALLKRVKSGDDAALGELMPLVYNELRRVAAGYMQGERYEHTLQPTALVHETYLRLLRLERLDWKNRAQFMGVAAQIMRRLLINYARNRRALKRGSAARAEFDMGGFAIPVDTEEIVAVDMAITRLAELNPEQSRVVEMRYFGGMSVEETAEAMAISPRTVKRHWALAKAWLHAELSGWGLD